MDHQPSDALPDRRASAVAAWGLDRGVVLVAAGGLVPIEGTDQFHPFHAHPEFRYLAGESIEAAVLAFSVDEGWTLFVPVATQDDRVWVGDSEPLEEIRSRAALELVKPLDELRPWLERRRDETLTLVGNRDLRDHPARYLLAPWETRESEVDVALGERLSEQLSELRRAKDPWELLRMERAAAASRAGHLLALRVARPGMTERALQVELEAEFFRAGAPRTAYGSIVGTGPDSSVLHFAPRNRLLREGDLVLIDAGAEWDGYASDVTRTFPAGSAFSGVQRDLYELVLGVQEAAIRDARPGKEYRELHLEAAARISDGLVQAGLLVGDPADLVDRDVHAIFFPHGLGHMLGLSTHDAGGCLGGRAPSDRFGLKWLRADLPLQPGYVVTIEPGIYFIRALLEDPAVRELYRHDVRWDRVDRLLDFGGIRIEDDIVITESEPRVLTADIPKAIGAIEALRSEALE